MTLTGSARILVVDDEPDVGALIVQVLERAGYRARAAGNGAEALDCLARASYDLVITDLRMPIMSGVELVEHIGDLYPDVGSMVLTAHATLESAIQVLKMGAQDYVVKPFDVQELTQKVARCLAEREERLAARHAPPAQLLSLHRTIARAPDPESACRDIFSMIERWFVVDSALLTLATPYAVEDTCSRLAKEMKDLPTQVVTLSPVELEATGAAVFSGDEPWVLHELPPEQPSLPGRYAVTVLLESGGHRLGTLRLARAAAGGAYTPSDAQALYILGAQFALTLRQAHTRRELRAAVENLSEMNMGAAQALVDALGTYDDDTRAHSRRVSEYARRLAARAGLEATEVESIAIAGLLHDIGKLGVSGRTLRKNGRLTETERRRVLLHPVQGAQILMGMESLREIVPLVRHHHERWDGTGYPDALGGNGIPVGARILAIVDAYDSMTSDRPYRSTLDSHEARRRLKRGAGSQWDARLVDLWLECLEEMELAAVATAREG